MENDKQLPEGDTMQCQSCNRQGWIEVIAGCMFAGKSEELIRRLSRLPYAKLKYQIFKPRLDDRDGAFVKSHDDNCLSGTTVDEAEDILALVEEDTLVVGIDEAQFFGKDLIAVCEELANRGLRVIVAGLDTTFEAEPFEPMPGLMAVAERVTKVYAHCVNCGSPAYRSHRLTASKEKVVTGAKGEYEALCRNCFSELKLEK